MFNKIKEILTRGFSWKFFINVVLSEICILPYVFLVSMYKIPNLFNLIMIFSLNFSLMFWFKALDEII